MHRKGLDTMWNHCRNNHKHGTADTSSSDPNPNSNFGSDPKPKKTKKTACQTNNSDDNDNKGVHTVWPSAKLQTTTGTAKKKIMVATKPHQPKQSEKKQYPDFRNGDGGSEQIPWMLIKVKGTNKACSVSAVITFAQFLDHVQGLLPIGKLDKLFYATLDMEKDVWKMIHTDET